MHAILLRIVEILDNLFKGSYALDKAELSEDGTNKSERVRGSGVLLGEGIDLEGLDIQITSNESNSSSDSLPPLPPPYVLSFVERQAIGLELGASGPFILAVFGRRQKNTHTSRWGYGQVYSSMIYPTFFSVDNWSILAQIMRCSNG